MADLVPVSSPAPSDAMVPIGTDAPALAAGAGLLERVGAIAGQPAVRRAIPAMAGLGAVAAAALAWTALSPSPQRTLYASLDDAGRAGVAAALDQAGIGYTIDNSTGALTVPEADYYRARMLVASDGALATPESGDEMLDSLPLGASRSLEGQRLRSARERDLEMTIREIDGVEAVRVHLAEAERSVFVRDNVPPSASVMVRLARGRQLAQGQIAAIVNLVAGSVPGLAPDAVRLADQHGRLLSDVGSGEDRALDLQARLEEKLRDQVSQLLTPMLGAGRFSSQIQVDLDMDEVTRARETYDKDGVVRSETQEQSQSTGSGPAVGVPGVLSNTPPPQTQAVPAPPAAAQPAATAAAPPVNGESSSSRTYELGREVSVANERSGSVRRLSVAVAIAKDALKGAKPADLQDLEALVSAAVGAQPQRGDQVKVLVRSFEPESETAQPFYETGWFAMLVRNGAAVLAVLLTLLIGVRPALKALRGEAAGAGRKGRKKGKEKADDDEADPVGQAPGEGDKPGPQVSKDTIPGARDGDEVIPRAQLLAAQVDLAQRLVAERPDRAVEALRQMLASPTDAEKAAA